MGVNMWYLILIPLIIVVSLIGLLVNGSGKHANKHEEADEIRRCFNKNGSCEVWKEFITKDRFHHIVKLDDGRYGDYIVKVESDGSFTEITALCPKDGSHSAVIGWVRLKAKKFM